MSTNSNRATVAAGPVIGIGVWLLGYGLVYLAAAPRIDDSAIQEILATVQGEPATYKLVGWLFYNAHFVETVVQGVPVLGDVTRNFIGSGLPTALYLVPAGVLVAAGLAVGHIRNVDRLADGVSAGMTVAPGYLVCSVVGVFLFEISIGRLSAGPALLPAVVVAGAIYPAFFAGIGGGVAALTAGETSRR